MGSRRILTNFYPIEFEADTFQIHRAPYSDDRLAELRSQHNSTHSFFRQGDFIYVSPMAGEPLDLGEAVTLSLSSDSEVAMSLTKHIMFRTMRNQLARHGYVPLRFDPLRILTRRPEKSLLRGVLPKGIEDTVSYRQVIDLHVRTLRLHGQTVRGIVVDLSYRWIARLTIADLIRDGFDVSACEVLLEEHLPGLRGVLAPKETFIGVLRSVAGGTAEVDTNKGMQQHEADKLILRRTRRQIGKYLAFKCGEDAPKEAFAAIRRASAERYEPNRLVEDADAIAEQISQREFRNLDSFVFHVSKTSVVEAEVFDLEPTKFIFDYSPGCSSNSILSGLLRHGPFDSASFDLKSPRILSICHKSNRGSMDSFLAKLINGMPQSRYFQRGLKDLFRLHDVSVTIEEATGLFPEDFEDAGKRALAQQSEGAFDLVVVEGRDELQSYSPNKNPYYRTKAFFMNLGMPVQCIREDRLKMADNQLQWILGPIALQMYAKMGGVPWVLPTSQTIDREIIVGVGHTLVRPNSYADAEQSRIVGLTTFFAGDGTYLMGRRMAEIEYDRYFDELLLSLKASIEQLSHEYGWQDGDTVRMVFHVFKPMKDLEAEVVAQLVSQYTQYKIRFAFVTISERHPYRLWDDSGTDLSIPERGSNVVIDENACLVQVLGAKERRSKIHRDSSPALVRIHPSSTYTDLFYITQQIVNLSHMSWRSFSPAYKPVTLFYADLIARLAGKLRQVTSWQPDALNAHFRSRQWFL